MLTAADITVRYGERTVVDRVSFTVGEGEWWMLAGPNGAGKSTLVEAIAQGVPYAGTFLLNGTDLRRMDPRALARQIGVLSQRNTAGYAYTVGEVVGLGRYAHRRGFLDGRDPGAGESVERALRLTGLEALRDKSILALSGGELQRTFLAQVFAQEPSLLILDEPANHLDLVYRKNLFSLLGEWLREPGRAILSVVHDLSLARRFGTHALLMHEGRLIAQGPAGRVLTPERLDPVYGMDVGEWMRSLLEQWT